MKRTSLLIALILCAGLTVWGDCKCTRPRKGETTRWGGNEMITIIKEKPLKRLQGRVEGPDGSPVEGALVEIFTHPECLLTDLPNARRDQPRQERVATCLTGADGKFCIRNLPSGTYELRSSISSGWDVTHVHVKVDPKRGQSEELLVTMHLGT